MTFIKAAVMGLIQGIAEFLPISSSGHLALFKHILDVDLELGGLLFDVLLHLGTLLAVFAAFWRDIRELVVEGFGILGDFFANVFRLLSNLFSKEKKEYKRVVSTDYRRFVMLVLVSTVPTGILGIVLEDTISAAAATVLVPGIFLLLTGVLLLVADAVEPGKRKAGEATYAQAAGIGIAQGIATMPGLSRSGTTIAACLLCGFDKTFAVKYSFIMSIPAVLGALVLELRDFDEVAASAGEMPYYLLGMAVAAVVGYICIKTMLVLVRGKKFKYFAYYCFVVGIAAVAWNFLG